MIVSILPGKWEYLGNGLAQNASKKQLDYARTGGPLKLEGKKGNRELKALPPVKKKRKRKRRDDW